MRQRNSRWPWWVHHWGANLRERLPGFLITQGIVISLFVASWANGYGWSLGRIYLALAPVLIGLRLFANRDDVRVIWSEINRRSRPPTRRR